MNKRLAIVLSTSFVFIAAIVLGGFFSFNNIKATGVSVGTSAFVCLIIYAVILFLLTLITFLYNFDIVYDDNWYYAYIGILLLLLGVAIWGNVEGDKLLYKEEIINNFSRKYFVVLLTSMIPTTIGVGAYHIYMLCDRSKIDEDSKYIFYFIPHMFIVFIYTMFYLISQFLEGGVYHTVYAIICLILAGGFAFIFFKFPNALSELFISYSEYKEQQKETYTEYEESSSTRRQGLGADHDICSRIYGKLKWQYIRNQFVDGDSFSISVSGDTVYVTMKTKHELSYYDSEYDAKHDDEYIANYLSDFIEKELDSIHNEYEDYDNVKYVSVSIDSRITKEE